MSRERKPDATPTLTPEQRAAMRRAKNGGWLLRRWIDPPRNPRDPEIIVPRRGRLVQR